jgi:hypothetical protein
MHVATVVAVPTRVGLILLCGAKQRGGEWVANRRHWGFSTLFTCNALGGTRITTNPYILMPFRVILWNYRGGFYEQLTTSTTRVQCKANAMPPKINSRSILFKIWYNARFPSLYRFFCLANTLVGPQISLYLDRWLIQRLTSVHKQTIDRFRVAT